MTTDPPVVSCVTVSYNTREATLGFLRSLIGSSPSETTEVIVVDNGSRDGTADAIRDEFPSVKLIDAGENLGFASGVNRGADLATGEYLLLLNPDMLVLPGSVTALIDFAKDHPTYGIYGGRTLRRDQRLEPSSCWAGPTIWSLLMFSTMLSTFFRGSPVFDPESMGTWKRDSVREVAIVTGCLLLIRRSLFQEIGRMDEDFFLYGEDAEFCLRSRALGWRPVIVPEATMIHDVGGSSAASGQKTLMVLAGKVTLFHKIWSPRRARVGCTLLLVGVAARALLARVLRRHTGWSTAWQRRRDWRAGYPAARSTIFGLPQENLNH